MVYGVKRVWSNLYLILSSRMCRPGCIAHIDSLSIPTTCYSGPTMLPTFLKFRQTNLIMLILLILNYSDNDINFPP